MSASQPVPANSPVMVAWDAYKETDQFANAKRWALTPEHTDGSLWAAFYEGFYAAAVNAAASAVMPADGALGRHEPDDGQALIPNQDSAK